MDFRELVSFIRVVELGTITAAAEAEGVPKSTISRRITRLEERLGLELLRRSTRSFSVTPDGQLLYERSRGALQELVDVERSLTDVNDVPTGTLVLTAPNDFGRFPILADILVEYRARYPEVAVELRFEQRVVDLVEEGVDVALRPHAGDIPGDGSLMARRASVMTAGLFASSAYLEQNPAPTTADLRDHTLILHSAMVRRPLQVVSPEGEIVSAQLPPPAIVANDFEVMRAMVERGVGIGVLPEILARRQMSGQELVPVLDGWHIPGAQISIVWPSSRHLAPRVRAFVELATEFFSRLTVCGDEFE